MKRIEAFANSFGSEDFKEEQAHFGKRKANFSSK